MDESIRHHNPNPILRANPLSKLLFWWMNPLFKNGYERQLEVEDMYNVVNEDQSETLGNRLEEEWAKEVERTKGGKRQPSLFRALFRMFGFEYLLLGLILLLEEATKVIQPLLLGGLIRYFTPGSGVGKTESYLFAGGVSLCALVLAVTHHPYFFGVQRIGMKMRIACCSLLYRKSLRLSNEGLSKTTTGQIVNLLSNDVNRFDQAVIFLHFLWVGPLEAVAVLAILWHELGPSTLAGFAVLLLLVPVQGWMGKLFSKFRTKTAKYTDERVRLMNEIIAGMRVIKMYCWEKPFGDLVKKVRKDEASKVKLLGYIRGLILGPFFVSVKLIAFLVYLAFVYSGGILTSERVFVSMALFQAVRLACVLFTPFAIQYISDSKVTFKRMQTFLQLSELPSTEHGRHEKDYSPAKNCRIVIENVHAKWDKEVDQLTLQNVSATVESGRLVSIIGPVGAGKSSLLMAVLNELPLLEGSISVTGRLAYVSQQPWVFSASLRQNIVFGNKYEKAKYDRILKACALNKDIAIMPHGDLTLIGDRGVSLSGGQRARVSLARALYMDADVYLLDDPLSAVDAAVGRHIFENVVQGYLKNKPRVLVTHQLQFLKEAEQILILKEGEMIGKGTFKELSMSGIDFSSLLKSDDEQTDKTASGHVTSTSGSHHLQRSMSHEPQSKLHESSRHRLHSTSSKSHEVINGNLRFSVHESMRGSELSLTSVGTIGDEFSAEEVQLPEEEERHQGTVGLSIYYEYFKAGAGIIKFLLLVFLCLAAQGAYILSDWWLSRWSNEEEARYSALERHNALLAEGYYATNITIPIVDTNFNVSVFSGIIGGVFLFGILRALMFFKVTVDASQALHNTMFASILRSHIGFFDTNPVGRILNRFSKDIGHMDDLLPVTFFDFTQCALLILGIVGVAGVVNPWVFIVVAPLIVLFVIIRRYYIRTSRHIKRLEGTTRSPVFSHLSASLQGLHTIRAFSVQGKFIEEFDNHQDLHTEAWFLFLTTSRWLAIRLDWLCAMFVAAVSFFCVVAADSLNAGLVGLSMTYAMTLMGMFQWGVRQSAEVENQMISVERVLDYSRLPSEAPLEAPNDRKPPPDWPQHGRISVQRVSLKYSTDTPTVLKNISFTIEAREKIGIVGRTGAGKSSLITMLFRLVEPTGSITIDDVDTLQIGLHDLRNQISIIPQDPVLFTGKLRRNLDPFSNHSDDALWKALGEVQLKNAVEDLPHGLDTEVSEGGINFSVGQRQLICLARAILRNNKILMIDEATANVDPRTDGLIQQTIREKFRKCTVLTIAHRLHTIMDSDRLLVLHDGEIEEFDAPHLLLQKPEGLLRKLVEQTGKTETTNLIEIARKSYENKNRDDINEEVQASNLAEIMRAISQHDVAMTIEELDELRMAESKEKEAENGTGDKEEDIEDAAEKVSREESETKDPVQDIGGKDEDLNVDVGEMDNGVKSVDGPTGETPVGDVDDEVESEEKSKLLADNGKKADDLDVDVGKVDENDEANETENLLSKDEHRK
ncbi:ATP-binding cassette sub-family C member 4-like isoform X4 [Dreissena polymorpha]|uniref:ATP-binding cassette sub-family C member 4-like isoform X4 n=1 Tax=Dreissena polymorpha TaxID=45954 RepID=UPI0022653F96|nr:ATP-binding cassette sub-family C member 4-like isoform X4 [Dreissena polymorpha]